MSGSTILVLAAAMAIVGVLIRWLLGKLFARRRKQAWQELAAFATV